jgi:hypothetical protein
MAKPFLYAVVRDKRICIMRDIGLESPAELVAELTGQTASDLAVDLTRGLAALAELATGESAETSLGDNVSHIGA